MTSSVVPVFTKSANGACYNKKKKFPLGCPPAVQRSRKRFKLLVGSLGHGT